jgi:hypothetical protein
VRELAAARFLVSAADWRARHIGIFPLRRTPSLKGVLTRPELVRFTGPGAGPFAAGHDHTEYGRALEAAFRGEPDPAALARVRDVGSAMVRSDGRLAGAAVPRFRPAPAGQVVGSVDFAPAPPS